MWAITNDSRVWYRKGIDQCFNEGTCWIKLNTFMFSVSVSSNDQVLHFSSLQRKIRERRSRVNNFRSRSTGVFSWAGQAFVFEERSVQKQSYWTEMGSDKSFYRNRPNQSVGGTYMDLFFKYFQAILNSPAVSHKHCFRVIRRHYVV